MASSQSFASIAASSNSAATATSAAGVVQSSKSSHTETIPEGFMGLLEVFIQHARDIHNICIYHKQDVYAKLCLTNDPDAAVSTKIINGGGRNPVFDERLRLAVGSAECSLKCELWMLSRVKNYLQDQLLGFALVPLSDVIMADGKILADKEFSLSSTDLFHSPAGFVRLSLSYSGSTPDVLAVAPPRKAMTDDQEYPISSQYEKIEFPDLEVVEENHLMVSEYFGIECSDVEAKSLDSLITSSENVHCPDHEEAGVAIVHSLSAANSFDSSSISTNESPVVLPATSHSVSGPLSPKDKSSDIQEGEADSSEPSSDNASSSSVKPLISINIEPEATVMIQQDIVDMYMKSMQQFTESLSKMKLPMDMENTTAGENGDSVAEKKLPASKGTGSRVFYGSRAFF